MPIVNVRTELDETITQASQITVGTDTIYVTDQGNGPEESNRVEAVSPNNTHGRSLNAAGSSAATRSYLKCKNNRAGELFVP